MLIKGGGEVWLSKINKEDKVLIWVAIDAYNFTL